MEYKIDIVKYKNNAIPEHEHGYYEVIIYLSGSGRLFFADKSYPVKKGVIALVPPHTRHGSVSDGGLKSIYVAGDFGNAFNFLEPIVLFDNDREEGVNLVTMIYNNRYGNKEYLQSLCTACARFILQNVKVQDGIGVAVSKITDYIANNFYDFELNLNTLLNDSGYSEDYIRAQFKIISGKTPNEYLTDIRIRHACNLIDLYKNAMSLTEVAELCGYTDYIYFSRKFKAVKGQSPQKYKNSISKNKMD